MKYKIDGWRQVICQEIIDVRDGTHDTPLYCDEGIPLITSKNLKSDGIDFQNVQFISLEDHQQIGKRSKVDKGDILYSMIGTIGNPVIVEVDREFSIKNVALFKLANNSEVFPNFFKYLLMSDVILSQLKNGTRGGIQEFVSLNVLRNLRVSLPPLPEQKRIASILDKADAVRRKRQETIRLLDEFLRSVFLEMFGDPVRNKVKKIELGKLTNRIVVGHVGPTTDGYCENGIPFIRTQNVRQMKINYNDMNYINENFHKKLKKSTIYFGDILLSRVGVNRGMAAVVPSDLNETNCANVVIVGSSKKFNSDYLAYYLNFTFGKNVSSGYSVGSAQGVINTSIVKKWLIDDKSISLQNEFSRIYQKVQSQRMLLEVSENELKDSYNSMMQRAFRGEL